MVNLVETTSDFIGVLSLNVCYFQVLYFNISVQYDIIQKDITFTLVAGAKNFSRHILGGKSLG